MVKNVKYLHSKETEQKKGGEEENNEAVVILLYTLDIILHMFWQDIFEEVEAKRREKIARTCGVERRRGGGRKPDSGVRQRR